MTTFIANKSKIKPKSPLNCSISPLACKHTHFSLLITAGGHFARRNFCDSATKKFHNDNVKSVWSWALTGQWSSYILSGFSYWLQMTDKSNVNTMNLWQNSQYLWNILSLSFAETHWQMNTTLFQIDQEKCKIEQIWLWDQRTVPDF